MDYELKPLTLAEREICNNGRAIIRDGKDIVIEDIFSKTICWLRYGLKSLNGVELNPANRDELINTLSNDEITEIANEIASRTNGGLKKKS